jgi:DNA-binding NtrC family response regulator
MEGPGARVLVVVREDAVRDAVSGRLRAEGHDVRTAADAAAASNALLREPHDAALVDVGDEARALLETAARLRPAALLVAAVASPQAAAEALRAGAEQVVPAPLDAAVASILASRAVERSALATENAQLRARLGGARGLARVVAESAAMQRATELARAAARRDGAVLLRGEDGTGKRLLARAIHEEGPDADAPFETVSCELDPAILEPVLFGEEVRAVTGATERRPGALDPSRAGTLFLDEIGGLAPSTQEEAARVLASRRGGPRVIASTSADLTTAVAEGRFRADLLAELSRTIIVLPPLRERREDVPFLAQHALQGIALELRRPVPALSPAALAALVEHSWPGNVPELRRVIERGALAARGPVLDLGDLGLAARPGMVGPTTDPVSLHELERRHIAEVLAHTGGNVSQAARLLAIDRVTLYNKMRRYGIQKRPAR